MDGRPTWTDCDEAGDYVVPNVLSPRDLVFRPDNMDENEPHTYTKFQASSHLLWLYSLICVGLVGNPKDLFSHNEAQFRNFTTDFLCFYSMFYSLSNNY